MTETELKPCPFCGGEARYYYEKGNDSIVCEECGAKLTYFDFGDANDELVKAWNTRLIEDEEVKHESTSYSCRACKNATDKEIKRLREALEWIANCRPIIDVGYPDIIKKAKEALEGRKND